MSVDKQLEMSANLNRTDIFWTDDLKGSSPVRIKDNKPSDIHRLKIFDGYLYGIKDTRTLYRVRVDGQ